MGEPRERAGVRGTVRRIAVDLAPFRVSRDFGRLWFGLLVSGFGYQFTLVAVFIQVSRLTDGSPAALGLVGLVGLAALILSTLVGGAFIDAYDRRTTLILAQVAYMVAASVLLFGAVVGDPPVWIVYAAVALISAVSAIDSPVRSAMTPMLIGRELLPSAAALNQVVFNTTALLGPAAAGLVIQEFDLQ